MIRSDLNEGDVVWVKVLPETRASKCIINEENPESWVFEGKITYIGRKYFRVNDRILFNISDLRQSVKVEETEYELYFSKEDALISIEKRLLFKKLQDICLENKEKDFSLVQLREAIKLLTA